MKASTPVEPDGIDPSRIYPLKIFMRLAGMGQAAMRAARRDGLPVRYLGNVGFVCGADFATYIEKKAVQSHRRATGVPDA